MPKTTLQLIIYTTVQRVANAKTYKMSSTKSSKSYKYVVHGKKARDTLNQEEQELFDLCDLAGIEISPAVLRIILDLLKLNVSPLIIAEMLKSMIHQGRQAGVSSSNSKMSSNSSRLPSRKGDKSASSRAGTSSSRGETSSSRDKERHRHEKSAKSNSLKNSGHT